MIDACQFGANLIIYAGQAVAIKTADNKAYGFLSTAASNDVQTVNFNIASTGGNVALRVPKPDGTIVQTAPAAWSATDATYLSNINSALDTATGVSGGIVASAISATDTDLGFKLTYSGTGYAGLPQAVAEVATLPTSSTSWNVVHTTVGGVSDGTQTFKGFSQYTFATDANGLVYYNGGLANPVAGYRTPAWSTSAIYTAGIFDPADLQTSQTPVAEVDTFTPGGSITTGDVYTITITYPDLTTLAISATVGATTTATAVSNLLRTAWNASVEASQYATASGTSTFILTSETPGTAMSVAGSVVGTGTVSKVVTTAATGRSIPAILAACPGARLLQNGFLLIPS
jgi:hypothetical protein